MVKYVSSIRALRTQIEKRKDDALIINQRLDEYWRKRGINWKEVREKFGYVDQDETELVLWRNFPETPNLERLITEVFTDLLIQKINLNLKLRLLSFRKDHFDGRNSSKPALVSVAALNNGNQKNIDYKEIEGRPLDRIMIGKRSLMDFHREMAEKVFILPFADNDIDIVRIFSLALVGALERGSNSELKSIGSVYIENCDTGIIEQFRLNERNSFRNEAGKTLTIEELAYLCKTGVVRPSAKWYYALFLSLFISGDRILLETFDDAPNFIPIVEKAEKMMKNEIGYEPLIVKIPVSVPSLATGRDIPTEDYPPWVLNGCPNKRERLYESLAYKNADSNLRRCLSLETCLLLIGMDIVLQS